MVLNEECMNDVLVYLAENLKPNTSCNKYLLPILSSKYSIEDIMYSLEMLLHDNFIQAGVLRKNNIPCEYYFDAITNKGQLLYRQIKSKS